MNLALAGLASYLLGGVPTSFLAAKYLAGVDLRQHGSGNLGATNLYRVLGGKYAYPVALLDVLKGLVPAVFFARWVGGPIWVPLTLGACAVVGHVFPIYMGFKGGKGVATAGGVVLGIAPLPAIVSVAIWAAVLVTTRIMSLASMVGAVAFPVAVAVLAPGKVPLLLVGSVLAAFIVFTHRSNIRRLLQGTEPRLSRNQEA